MKRRKFITLISGLAIARPLAAFAQEPEQPLRRVGVLAWLVPCPLKPDNLVIFRLWELGWNEEQHIVFDRVSAVSRVDQVPAPFSSRSPGSSAIAHEVVRTNEPHEDDRASLRQAEIARWPHNERSATVPAVSMVTRR